MVNESYLFAALNMTTAGAKTSILRGLFSLSRANRSLSWVSTVEGHISLPDSAQPFIRYRQQLSVCTFQFM